MTDQSSRNSKLNYLLGFNPWIPYAQSVNFIPVQTQHSWGFYKWNQTFTETIEKVIKLLDKPKD